MPYTVGPPVAGSHTGMRLAFISSSLESGGLEHEVEANVQLALTHAHEVRLFTPYKVRDDSRIRRNLEQLLTFDSGQEEWRRSFYGRAVLSLAKAKHLLTARRRPSSFEEVSLGRRFMPVADQPGFWDEQARRVVAGSDLVHLFGKPKPFMARVATSARAAGVKVIYEEASQVTAEYANRRLHRQFTASSASCDVIIARCQRHIDDIRTHYQYRGATRVIEQWAYGTEDDLLGIDRAGHRATGQALTFGSIGRLDDGKGMDTILKAFARAKQHLPDSRLRIAGAGQHATDLRKLAADLRIDGDTEFVGHMDGGRKIAFYAGIDAFVIASLNEGGPITGVEAMAAGLPILSTPVGAMPERLEHGTEALFFEPGSAEALAASMALLQDASLRHRLGCSARHRYGLRNHSQVCAPQKTALWNELGRPIR
ncbi:MAG: glycosyltransferase [Luteitalea sp.]|nr:glycosyltransferase [Luteitalea sp.]